MATQQNAEVAEAQVIEMPPSQRQAYEEKREGNLLPALVSDLKSIEENLKNFRDFARSQMKEGEDFMAFTAGGKNNLLKSGAEKLLTYHGFGIEFDLAPGSVESFDVEKPFLRYVYTARVYDKRTGMTIVAGVDGEANSYESRYFLIKKWPNELTPKEVEQAKANELDFEVTKTGKKRFIVKAPPHYILAMSNTLRKMALKRALVAATIIACRASGVFTQDLEDMEGAQRSSAPPPPAARPAPKIVKTIDDNVLEAVRGVAKRAGYTELEPFNQFCREKVGVPWMTYDSVTNVQTYHANAEQAAIVLEELKPQVPPQTTAGRSAGGGLDDDLASLFGGEEENL
jgi:hypothetical protein